MNSALISLKQTLPMRMAETKSPIRPFLRSPKANHTPVVCHGGIGDMLLTIGPAERLHEDTQDVVMYTRWPEIASLFTDLPCRQFDEVKKRGFDVMVNVNAIAIFQFSGDFEGFRNAKLAETYIRNRGFLSVEPWDRIAEYHPNYDNILGDEAMRMGVKRWQLPYLSLGYEPRDFKRKPKYLNKVNYGKSYITIHDGFDQNNEHVLTRATKTWNMPAWKEFVRLFKKEFPEILVVQIGGPASRRVLGVDISRVSTQSFAKSLDILSGSVCHVDGDSGITHAARMIGVPVVAMFGPTPKEFFGYEENKNISSGVCENCWWLTRDWVATCPARFGTPECMDHITPEEVLKNVAPIVQYNLGRENVIV